MSFYKFDIGGKKHKTPQERKDVNLKIIKDLKIRYNEKVPVIEAYDEVEIRTKEEIVKRLIPLYIVSRFADRVYEGYQLSDNQKIANDQIEAFKAHDYFTQREFEFLEQKNVTKEDATIFTWMLEDVVVLLWTLGFINKIETPEFACDLNGVKEIEEIMNENNSLQKLLDNSVMKDKEELLDQADLYFRLNWACIDAKHNYETIPILDPGVVLERLITLNWLTCYQNKDWE